MTSTGNIEQLISRTAVDNAGRKLGTIGQVYLDDRTGQPVLYRSNTRLGG
jgi:sporulation protein YlmC with PRC-barrel domain